MSQSLRLSARSILIAGVSTVVVGAMAIAPVGNTALMPVRTVSSTVQLSAALAPLVQPADSTPVVGADPILYTAAPTAAAATSGIESFIKNTYNAIEPWVAWGFQLAEWAMSFVPILWWVAPGIDLAYFTIEPLVQAGVFVVADVLGLDFTQIGPDIKTGIQQSWQNFVNYSLAWIGSLIPLPPLPPFPPRPGASVLANNPVAASRVAAVAATSVVQEPAVQEPTAQTPAADVAANAVTTAPVETATAPPAARATRSAVRAARATVAATTATAPSPAAAEAADPAPAEAPVLSAAPETVAAEAPAPVKASRSNAAHTGGHAGKAARSAARAG